MLNIDFSTLPKGAITQDIIAHPKFEQSPECFFPELPRKSELMEMARTAMRASRGPRKDTRMPSKEWWGAMVGSDDAEFGRSISTESLDDLALLCHRFHIGIIQWDKMTGCVNSVGFAKQSDSGKLVVKLLFRETSDQAYRWISDAGDTIESIRRWQLTTLNTCLESMKLDDLKETARILGLKRSKLRKSELQDALSIYMATSIKN
jgi:hypothetical protein